jgi:hypothetical protein
MELAGRAITIGNQTFQDWDASFRSAIRPSAWCTRGSFGVFVVLAAGLSGEPTDNAATSDEARARSKLRATKQIREIVKLEGFTSTRTVLVRNMAGEAAFSLSCLLAWH